MKTMQPPTDIPTLLTSRETAAYLRLSLDCLRRMRNDGRIKFIRLGRAVRYRPADVHRLLEEGEAEAELILPSTHRGTSPADEHPCGVQ